MGKYNKKIVAQIISLIESDSYTIPEICGKVGINQDTYHDWKKTKPEFSEQVAQARQVFDEKCIVAAKRSLMKKVEGYTVKETKTVFVEAKKKKGDDDSPPVPTIKEKTVIDKHFQPDTQCIIFVLTNKAPKEYKNKQNTELTGKDGKELNAPVTFIPASSLTQEQIDKFLNAGESENAGDNDEGF